MPPASGGLVHRGQNKPVATSLVGASKHRYSQIWNMAVVLHCCPHARGTFGSAANHIFGRWAPDPPKPAARAREADDCAVCRYRVHRYASDAIGSLETPRDVSPTTPVMRPRRSRDLPRAIPSSTCSQRETHTEVGDICLTVVAWQGCSASLFVNLWSYSSNFTGSHPPTPSR